jgi:hypothetical protein
MVRGEPLHFTCGRVSSGQTFGAIYTRRPKCQVYLTIVVGAGDYRRQGCVSPAVPRGFAVIRCEADKKLVVAATTQPKTLFVTVRLVTGREFTSTVLSRSSTERARWGGVYYNVLPPSGSPSRAILMERDSARHALRRMPLTVLSRCGPGKGSW